MKYRHRVLGPIGLLAAITYLDRIAISVAGPRMQEDLGISPQAWGWVVGIFTLSYALFEIPTGRIGDRTGARRVLTRIVLWWSAFTGFTGMTSNYYVLLLTRFCFGAGEAGFLPNVGISLSRWFPMIERARARGVLLMCLQAGGALAPYLSCAAFFTVATMLTAGKFATLLFLGLVYAGITLQQTVVIIVVIDISRKYVGGIMGVFNMVGGLGGFVFSVSFGYFVAWFGSYDLALIPVALMPTIAALAWLRVDATEELILEAERDVVPDAAVPVLS